MVRAFSIFTMSAWAAFHAVSALFYSLAVSRGGGLIVLSGTEGDGPAALLALAHAALAGLSVLVGVRLHRDRDMGPAELRGLIALAFGLAVAAFAAATGLGGRTLGFYAVCVAVTLLGFAFDRRMGPAEDEEEADHKAFMRLAAELGAEAGRRDEPATRRPLRR